MSSKKVDWSKPVEVILGTTWHPAAVLKRYPEYDDAALLEWTVNGNPRACIWHPVDTYALRNTPETVEKVVYLYDGDMVRETSRYLGTARASARVTFTIGQFADEGDGE